MLKRDSTSPLNICCDVIRDIVQAWSMSSLSFTHDIIQDITRVLRKPWSLSDLGETSMIPLQVYYCWRMTDLVSVLIRYHHCIYCTCPHDHSTYYSLGDPGYFVTRRDQQCHFEAKSMLNGHSRELWYRAVLSSLPATAIQYTIQYLVSSSYSAINDCFKLLLSLAFLLLALHLYGKSDIRTISKCL